MGTWTSSSATEYVALEETLFVKGTMSTIDIEPNVDFVVGKLISNPDGPVVLRTIKFDKLSEKAAQKWVEGHGDLLKAFGQEIFSTPVATKAENMLVDLQELSDEDLSDVQGDELEAIHALLHAMNFRTKAGLETTDWDTARIKGYHGKIVEAMKSRSISHFHMSELDDGVWLSEEPSEEGEEAKKEAPFSAVMSSATQSHAHSAVVDGMGNGFTSIQKDHSHVIIDGAIVEASGHSHALTDMVCDKNQLSWLTGANAESLKAYILKSFEIS